MLSTRRRVDRGHSQRVRLGALALRGFQAPARPREFGTLRQRLLRAVLGRLRPAATAFMALVSCVIDSSYSLRFASLAAATAPTIVPRHY